MYWNIVELSDNGRYAKVDRGFLVVEHQGEELGRVILDELSCLLLSAEQATLSKPLMVRLAELGIPIVICGKNYHPISFTLPYSANSYSGKTLRNQISASKPLQKRLWQQVVRQKIANQKTVLAAYLDTEKEPGILKRFDRLIKTTSSGDVENCEAQAANLYWPRFFDKEFRRRQDSEDFLNSALNYGYTILRGSAARSLVAAGLQPALGIHHRGLGNPFCLADDLMEPFRPLVDNLVRQLWESGESGDLNPQTKSELVHILQTDVRVGEKATPVSNALQHLSFSLAQSLASKQPELALPVIEFIEDCDP